MKIRGITVGTPIKPERALLAAGGMTPEQQAQIRKNFGAASIEEVGDIETALDEILVLQEGLISGTPLPDASEVSF